MDKNLKLLLIMEIDVNNILALLSGILKLDTKKGKYIAIGLAALTSVLIIGIILRVFIFPSSKQVFFIVSDELTGNPLESVAVTLEKNGQKPQTASTDNRGIVPFDIKETDSCSKATARIDGYSLGLADNSRLLTDCSKITSTIPIKIKPERDISFRIVDEDSEKAVINAAVTLNLKIEKVSPKKTDAKGVVSFPISSSDQCVELVVEIDGYNRKRLEHPNLIENCYGQQIQELKLKKKVPDSPEVTGKSPDGKKADFIFSSLIDGYAWKLGDSKKIVLRGKNDSKQEPVDAKQSIISYLSNPTFLADIKDSEMLIAIGSSSCEGQKSAEEDRAKERGEVIREALKNLPEKPRGKDIPAFTLGQYVNPVCESNLVSTDIQRRLLIVRVVKMDAGTNIPLALNDAARQNVVKKWLQEYLLLGDNGNGIRPYSDLDIKKFSGYSKFNPY
jgi:hypothetical protein